MLGVIDYFVLKQLRLSLNIITAKCVVVIPIYQLNRLIS
jgi:hypothetical protein